MTTMHAAMSLQSALLFVVRWFPEDWPGPLDDLEDCLETYVVAKSADEALKRLTDNPLDMREIKLLGPVIERVVKNPS